MYSLDVNFLKDRPDIIKPQKEAGRRSRGAVADKSLMYAGVAAGLLPLAVVGGILLYQQGQTGKLEKELAEIQAKNAATNAQLQEAIKKEKEADELTQDAKGLAAVFDRLKPWSAMLQDVRDRLPAGVQLTCIAQIPPSPTADFTNTDCQSIQATSNSASAASGSATDTVIISGLTYDFSNINNFLLTLQQSPFLKGTDTQLVNSELKDYPIQWQQGQRGNTPSSGEQPKLRKVVAFTIKTSLSDVPASKLLRELERKGALGLVTRIENLQQKGVLQNDIR